ncbi:hypothetical protein RDI58_004181 [Solanum bulbocastanum]|uniref:Uncharacterized protein n=1 Tax=Solanum bulbocastanum TaxID=147425 RepID=A0AAN8YL24_SOLBU
MGTEAPSWADQWGTGGFGAMDEEESHKSKKENDSNKKNSSSAGLGKAKAVALAGAQKMKNGTSIGIKWVRSKCQKKNMTSSS